MAEKIYCNECGKCQDDDDFEFTLENPSQDDDIDEGFNYYCNECASRFT